MAAEVWPLVLSGWVRSWSDRERLEYLLAPGFIWSSLDSKEALVGKEDLLVCRLKMCLVNLLKKENSNFNSNLRRT